MNTKKLIFLILLFSDFYCFSQSINNVDFKVRKHAIIVTYDLNEFYKCENCTALKIKITVFDEKNAQIVTVMDVYKGQSMSGGMEHFRKKIKLSEADLKKIIGQIKVTIEAPRTSACLCSLFGESDFKPMKNESTASINIDTAYKAENITINEISETESDSKTVGNNVVSASANVKDSIAINNNSLIEKNASPILTDTLNNNIKDNSTNEIESTNNFNWKILFLILIFIAALMTKKGRKRVSQLFGFICIRLKEINWGVVGGKLWNALKYLLRKLLEIIVFITANLGKPNSKNSTGSAESISGTKRKNYFCKYCGQQALDIIALTSRFGKCRNHPNGPNKGNHIPYQGREKKEYECNNCGQKASSIFALTSRSGNCRNHPNGFNKGTHIPREDW